MNDKQRRFAEEYIIDLNATQAAIRAGYSPRTAGAMGFDLLKNPEIQAVICKAQDARAERTHITQDRVLQEIARLAFFDPRKLYDEQGNIKPIHELDDDTAACIGGLDVLTTSRVEDGKEGEPVVVISEVTKKFKIWDKNSALEKAGKHLKLFTDVSEVKLTMDELPKKLEEARKRVAASRKKD